MVSDSFIVDNSAVVNGGGVFNSGSAAVNNSCISGNSATIVVNVFGPALDATNNWWGSSDGPSGAGPGTGDSVSSGVTFMLVFTS